MSVLPLHHPVVLAKALCTLDWLTNGRAAMTVGVGWQKAEYRALGVRWEERGRLADEYLAAMLELLRNDRPAFDGKYVSFADIAYEPTPVQRPHPPLWVGGESDGALRPT